MKTIITIAIILIFCHSCSESSSVENIINTESPNLEETDSVQLVENELKLEIGTKSYESSEFENLGHEMYNLEAIGGIQIGQELNLVLQRTENLGFQNQLGLLI